MPDAEASSALVVTTAAAAPPVTPPLASSDERPPWRRSWLHCSPGEVPTLIWIALLHVLTLVGLVMLPLPPLGAIAIAFAFAFLGGLGTTIAYHRSLAHRAVSLNVVVEQTLVAFAVLNGSGNPANWVRMHRLHHATSDRADDISSPHQGGFWWSHLRWLWQADTTRGAGMAPDLDRMRFRFWARAQVPMLLLSLCMGLLWALRSHAPMTEVLAAALWIGPLRLLYSLHVQCTVNSVCHLGPITGEHGSGRNIWWLGLAHMGHGENWHENHHRRPGDPRIGHGWQLDLGWLTICVLKCFRAARLRGQG